MKRLAVPFLTMMMLIQVLNAQDRSSTISFPSRVFDVQDCRVMRIFVHIWEIHPLSERESGAWIIRNDKGEYEEVDWLQTLERNETTWSGVLPSNIVAQVHTHGDRLDPKPSGPDSLIARRLNIDVYTVARKGIWKVSPDGTISSVLKYPWLQESTRKCGESEAMNERK